MKNFVEISEKSHTEIWKKLKTDPKPPNEIFAKFNDEAHFRELFSRPSVAIVGSRKPTEYGKKITLEISRKLAEHGVVIISGLALGHDSLAHAGCVDGGGTTIAVLGTPIDKIYPSQNLSLSEKIILGNGAILSEIPAGAKSGVDWFAKTSFLARNRIISALADITIIIEANVKSGSLNTAKHARKQGKIVMAVPGNLTSPMSEGTNILIKNGAKICLGAESVLAELREIYKNDMEKITKLGGGKRKISRKINQAILTTGDAKQDAILAILAGGEKTSDEIFREIPDAGGALTLLELDEYIVKIGESWALKK